MLRHVVLAFALALPLPATTVSPLPGAQEEGDVSIGQVVTDTLGALSAAAPATWLADDASIDQTVTALLAYLADGHSLAPERPFTRPIRAGAIRVRNAVEAALADETDGELDGATLAALLDASLTISDIEESPPTSKLARQSIDLALRQQAEDGTWGEDATRVESTASVVLSLGAPHFVDASSAKDAIARGLAALDRATDERTGAVTPFEGASDADVLRATANVVTAKLLTGVRPGSDARLARSIAWVVRRIVMGPEALPELSARGWEALVLVGLQIEGRSDRVKALLASAVSDLSPEVRRLRALGRLETADDVRSAAAIVGVFTSHFRHARALGDD
ncbi:MAG: hypothetical protein AAFP86_14730 [Planctomycetota bacterium]